MPMDTSSPNPSTWFEELDMEDPIFLHEFVVDCLVDEPSGDLEAIMHEVTNLSSPGSDCNSPTSIAEISNNKHDGATKKSLGLEEGMKDAGNTMTTPRKRPKRLPEQCHNHIIAERQRRQTLSERFIALSALIPGLKKMDKTTILGAAITHMQQLKERLKILEEQNATKLVESVVVIKRPQVIVANKESNSSTSDHNLSNRFCNEQLPHIEARFSSNNVLILIHCEMQTGIPLKIMNELEKLKLLVTTANAMPFDGTLDITIMAQMKPDFNMRPEDVVKSLRSIFR